MPGRSLKLDSEISALADEHARDPEALLTIFQALQARHGGLTRATINDTARALRLPPERAFGVASFYSMLSLAPRPPHTQVVHVCDGPACWLKARLTPSPNFGADWVSERTSCLGLCDRAPAALVGEQPVGPLAADGLLTEADTMPSYAQARPGEVRVLLARLGKVDPDSLESALAHGAYGALQQALAQSPEAVLAVVENSKLTGRGGAGFPAGRKWRMVAREHVTPKYVVCNADESEPLVFKDRALIDGDPHQLLEGLALAGYAVGAQEGFIYIRGEYGPQAARLERAIQQAEAQGWLGERIRGTNFSFHLHIHRGAGAYICGEETALLESLEGKRGEPRLRPPYPTTHGYRGQPTLVNNVETFSAVPAIVLAGADWYRGLSSASTPGTKLYTLLGHVQRPGLFEAPFGLTVRQIVEDFGGGMAPDSQFHFALTGGAAGTIVPESLLDVSVDYTSTAQGVALGAGAFLICDQTVSPVALLREVLHFFEVESCGKCTPCRIGTHQARMILDRLISHQGQAGDVAQLSQLAEVLQSASLCGLGQSAAMPMKSALQHFDQAFQAAERRLEM